MPPFISAGIGIGGIRNKLPLNVKGAHGGFSSRLEGKHDPLR